MTTQVDPGKLTLAEQVIEQIQVSNAGLEKAAAELKRYREKEAAVAELIPKACDVMVQFERISPTQREKLAEALKDPARVLDLLIKVAGHRNDAEIARLGQGVKEAAAGGGSQFNSLASNYVGERHTRERESDRRFMERLG